MYLTALVIRMTEARLRELAPIALPESPAQLSILPSRWPAQNMLSLMK